MLGESLCQMITCKRCTLVVIAELSGRLGPRQAPPTSEDPVRLLPGDHPGRIADVRTRRAQRAGHHPAERRRGCGRGFRLLVWLAQSRGLGQPAVLPLWGQRQQGELEQLALALFLPEEGIGQAWLARVPEQVQLSSSNTIIRQSQTPNTVVVYLWEAGVYLSTPGSQIYFMREKYGYRQPGLLYTPQNFVQSSKFLGKKYFWHWNYLWGIF
jgi:hypothetical protein